VSQPGRVSGAALAVQQVTGVVTIAKRAAPPLHLTDEQSEIWIQTLSSLPATWLNESNLPLLEVYCSHVVKHRKIGALIEQCELAEKLNLMTLNSLYMMQEREGRAITSAATKMRITPQSTYDKTKKKETQGKRPWET